MVLGILILAGLVGWIIFSEHEVRTYTYVHPSHFLDDLKFVAASRFPPVRDESRGALTLARAPRASSLHVVR